MRLSLLLEMELNDLSQILESVPILLVPRIRFRRGLETYEAEGLAVNRQKQNHTALQYTVLNYNCDDLARGLLHESIHHYYWGGLNEFYIEKAERIFWENPHMKKMCQKKIIDLLGEKGL